MVNKQGLSFKMLYGDGIFFGSLANVILELLCTGRRVMKTLTFVSMLQII